MQRVTDGVPGEEVPFGIEEMFYSRTDGRGVIVAGNSVFQRISCYHWTNLIGAPHRIVRHPATPRAVFRVLWASIQAGEPAVAYVCNKTADGRPYWVLATVLPFGTGYLSIRIKPSSWMLPQIKVLYADLVEEEANGRSVDASALELHGKLLDLGFADYTDFMRQALRAEFTSRLRALGLRSPLPEKAIADIQEGIRRALEGQRAIQSEFEWMQVLPTNLSLLANRLEPEGGPMTAVADLYQDGTQDALSSVSAFTAGDSSLCNRMSEQFQRAVFMVTCAELQRELGKVVSREDWTGSGLDANTEVKYINDISRRYTSEAQACVDEALRLANVIGRAGDKMHRSIMSLETIMTIGKVEGARFGTTTESINTIITSLHEQNSKLSRVMANVVNLSAIFCGGVEELRTGFGV